MSQFVIKMLTEQRASMDGFHTRVFQKGEVLQVGSGEKDITDTLARRFINRGVATEV